MKNRLMLASVLVIIGLVGAGIVSSEQRLISKPVHINLCKMDLLNKNGQMILLGIPQLTNEEKQKALKITLLDPKVNEIIQGRDYTVQISKILIMQEPSKIVDTGKVQVKLVFLDKNSFSVNIDLKKERVTYIDLPIEKLIKSKE